MANLHSQAKACATPVHRQPHHRAQGHARGTFGQERLAVVEPGGAGDIQVYPRRRVGELLQEHGGRNRTSVTAAHVGDVGEGAFQIILVIVLQRHVPHFFALRARRCALSADRRRREELRIIPCAACIASCCWSDWSRSRRFSPVARISTWTSSTSSISTTRRSCPASAKICSRRACRASRKEFRPNI